VHRDDRTRYRWWSDVHSYPSLDAQAKFGPAYVYEYSSRDAYGSGISWGSNDPLNATWWHHVTESSSYLHPSYLTSSDSLFSASRDASKLESCFGGARIFASLCFAVDQLMSLVEQTFTNFQGKQSVRTAPCNTTQCVTAKICYMRSGSASIALQNCQSGFGSVQS
jgi:sphingomyelin phosphodiesterase